MFYYNKKIDRELLRKIVTLVEIEGLKKSVVAERLGYSRSAIYVAYKKYKERERESGTGSTASHSV